jgi:hypothetical protein
VADLFSPVLPPLHVLQSKIKSLKSLSNYIAAPSTLDSLAVV